MPKAKAAGEPPTRSLDSQAKIIEAALQEFATVGFEGARVASIAARAGVKHPLVHHYFGSKEQLWEVAVRSAFEPLVRAYQESMLELQGTPPLEVVRIMVRKYMMFSARYPAVGSIVSRESMIGGPRLKWLAAAVIAPLHRSIADAYAAAVASGDLRAMPEANVIQALIGAVVHYYSTGPLLSALYGLNPLEPRRVQEHADVVVEIFLNGLKTREG